MARAARILIVTTALTLAGCSGVQKTVDGWFGKPDAGSAQETGSVYYAASDGLVMRAEASGSSAVVGRLALYEKVVRTRQQSGWAYVTADRTGTAGWVDNAQLIWRLPGAPASASPASVAPAPATTTADDAAKSPAPASEPEPVAAPEPVASPAPVAAPPPPIAVEAPAAVVPAATAAPKAASPEIFDPF